MVTVLLTWNPVKWAWGEREEAIRRTSSGSAYRDQWSIGSRTGGVGPGDRAFLLRQGLEPRGIVASGTVVSAPFLGPHWDGTPGRSATFVGVEWELVVDDDEVLPTRMLMADIPMTHWNPMGGGTLIAPPGDALIAELWGTVSGASPGPTGPGGGWQDDPVKRREVQDYGQRLLEDHFRNRGWTVEDTRYGNPFDAVATSGSQRRYLEAKGTQGDGGSVLVTPGEVDFARRRRGECIMGIVSNIKFSEDGQLDATQAHLRVLDWDPNSGTLTATGFSWSPQP
jgi:hypothetical protein